MPTIIGTLELTPTIENIGVVSRFIGDLAGNNQALLEYRQVGDISWKQGVPMSVDRRATMRTDAGPTTPNPYQNTWRASIFWLQPNTQYEVRVTYTDPDGVGGTNPVSGTVITRNDNPPSNGGTYYVSTTGNDANNGLTTAAAFRTIQKAANTVAVGDKVLIMPGTYNEQVNVTASGTENNYITFQSFDMNNKAVIDGIKGSGTNPRGTLDNNFYLDGRQGGSKYIRIKGLILRWAATASIHIEHAQYTIVEDSIIEDFWQGYWDAGVLVSGGKGTLIQRNQIKRSVSNLGGESSALFFVDTLGEHVVKDNQILGPYGAFKDGIGGDINAMITGGVQNTTYIYNNYIESAWDDLIEIEGGDVNVGVWNNILKGGGRFTPIGIATAPALVGPVYIFRNVIIDFYDSAWKMGSESFGPVFLYHNTFYSTLNAAGPADFGTRPASGNTVARNNIFAVSRYVLADPAVVVSPSVADNTWDYNNGVLVPGGGYSAWWAGVRYDSFTAFKVASGQELNGKSVDPIFVNPNALDFRLAMGSLCINAGIPLPQFNGPDSPWPYLGSAPDLGAIESGIAGVAPVADFTANPQIGTVPLTVTFMDASIGEINTRLWDFGDGQTSDFTNSTHVFLSPGIYTVTLTVNGPGGSSSKQAIVQVTTEGIPPSVATLLASPISGVVPLTVTFSDVSTGDITSSIIDFGDGSNPISLVPDLSTTHEYTQSGTFIATLTITVLGGSLTSNVTIIVENSSAISSNVSPLIIIGIISIIAAAISRRR